ncbi:MAG: arylesterase [Saprospiraceae bacterium]|nr:arylesterase [Saprospiraceae bacterium]
MFRFSPFLKIAFAAGAFLLLQSCGDEAAKNDTPQTSSNQEEATVNTNSKERTILFFGNSLTAGLGLPDDQTFTYIIDQRLDSLGVPYTVVNAGLSGETSAGGLGRVDWVLQQPVDIFVLELGANDALRGIELNSTRENLRGILQKVKEKYPDADLIVAGMLAPPNMGAAYSEEFKSIYPALAKEFNAGLIPFLLDGVGGIPEMNQQDGIHPNAAGEKIVVENIWPVLEEYL